MRKYCRCGDEPKSQTDMEKQGMYCIFFVWHEFRHLCAVQMKYKIFDDSDSADVYVVEVRVRAWF